MSIETIKSRWIEAFRLPKGYEDIPTLICESKADVPSFKKLKTLKRGFIIEAIKNGWDFYVYGATPGTGKTSWAVDIGKAYYTYCINNLDGIDLMGEMPTNIPVVFLNVNDYLEMQKKGIEDSDIRTKFNKLNSDARKCDLLIVDDIGYCQSYSEYDEYTVSQLVNTRAMEKNKTTIYTSNRTPQQLGEVINPKTIDRLFNKNTKLIPIKAKKSRR